MPAGDARALCLGLGDARRRARLLPLDEGHGETGAERHQRDGRGRRGDAVAAHELAETVGERVGARLDRSGFEPAPQIGSELAHRPVAPLQVGVQRPRHHQVEVAGELAREPPTARALRRHPARPHQRLALDLGCQRRPAAGLARKRQAPGEQLVEHDAERPDVGGRGHRLAADLLGRRVLGVSACRRSASTRPPRRVEQLGDAEVEQLRPPLGGDQDVRRLEIAVHHQPPVRAPTASHTCSSTRSRSRRRAVARHQSIRAAGDLLERQKGAPSSARPPSTSRGDPGVREAGEDLPLEQETVEDLLGCPCPARAP